MLSKGTSKLLSILVIAALLALGVTACGGGDDSTGSTATSTAAGESGSGESTGGGAESTTGEGAASKKGSAGFIVPGGDNSIQSYGEEADAGERKKAEEALAAYLDARAAGDWAKACAHLAATAVKPLEQLAASSPKLKGNCAALLAQLQKAVPPSELDSTLINGLASLRVQGNRAFALYHGPRGTDYFVLMEKDGDGWTVAALAPSPFP